MIPPLTPGGLLPLGRHHTTLDELEKRFVQAEGFARSESRQPIWTDFDRALTALRTLVAPCAAWFGGSFTTSKVDPDDIDVTWILPRAQVNAVSGDPVLARRLALFAGEHRLIDRGVRVDSYIAGWAPYAEPTLEDLGCKTMAAQRGYWDDWWQRLRPDGGGVHPSSSIPRRGYLEVTLDGYPL